MKILVTGGAGFIGSNIVDVLLDNKHKVVVIDNLSSGKTENLTSCAKLYEGDITDKYKVEEVFDKERPDIVIHNAAQIDVRKSVDDPNFDAQVNILGSINVLRACAAYKTKKIIFASSGGTIYGECGKTAPDENVVANPLSPYGIAKLAVEGYIKFYSFAYGLKYTILRYSNVYGPRQDPHGEAGVVAIFSNKMLSNEHVKIFGNGRQMRDYVFVSDVADANLKALSKGNNQIINIGTKTALSVLELAKIMSKVVGSNKKPLMKPKRAGELFKNFLNYDKAVRVLGWKPKVDINEGIKKTIEFFRNSAV